jgi:hypothetical protein
MADGDASRASCPNAGLPSFRPYLPDCRGYELVTPPYKGGDFVAGDPATITASGSELLGESLANFAEEAPKVIAAPLNPYRFSRTSSGWATSALLTPSQAASLARPGRAIDRILFRHRDEDGRSLWSVLYRVGSEPTVEAIFFVEQADGSFVEIGPATPGPVGPSSSPTSVGSAEYAVSPGISRTVFDMRNSGLTPGEHWPGDTTVVGNESLYEYTTRHTGEPLLVGVRNEHFLSSNAEAELISSCGTFLGASFGDKRGALSQDGRSVLFTAAHGQGFECAGPAVDEIYVRLDGEHTVRISEPSHHDCEECNVATGLESPVFQAASADTSKIYFTTRQELLPGGKGNNLYLYDFASPAGHKITLVSAGASEPNVQGVVRVCEDGSRVYFVAQGVLTGENAEHRMPSNGLDNLYVFERGPHSPAGHLSFVATLATSDEADWEAGDVSHPATTTPDGQYLVFTSSADLTSDDTSSQRQLFEYDATHESLARISIGQRNQQHPSGFNEDGNTTNEIDRLSIVEPVNSHANDATGNERRTMSDDGRAVFFQTPLALAPGASENMKAARLCGFGVETEAGECLFGERPVYVQNVYEYRWTQNVADGNVFLISGGQDNSAFGEGEAVKLLGPDRTGTNVLFTTSQALVPQDLDTQVDIYDARAEGGFRGPAVTASCSSECETAQPVPALAGPASALVSAGENLAAAPVKRPTSKATSRDVRLTRALKQCHKKRGLSRRRCEAQARRRYRAPSKAHKGRSNR